MDLQRNATQRVNRFFAHLVEFGDAFDLDHERPGGPHRARLSGGSSGRNHNAMWEVRYLPAGAGAFGFSSSIFMPSASVRVSTA
jgi:hypothetical protein